MRFIVLRRSDGSGNFQEDDPLHQAYLTGLEAAVNGYYANFEAQDPACNVYDGGESYIRFKLTGITYLDDDALYNFFPAPPLVTSNMQFDSFFLNYGINKEKEINVFFVEAKYQTPSSSNANAIAYRPGKGSSSGNGQLPAVFMLKTWSKIVNEFTPPATGIIGWMINAWTLPHELGHCLNLPDLSPITGGGSPNYGECERFMVTQWAFPSSPTDGVPHTSITLNELAVWHKSLTENTVSNYVCNCPYSPNTPIEVTSSETWDCYMRIYTDVVVQPGATLTLTNLLLMPKDARITIMPGAKLIINGGKISSGCDNEYWQGIQVLGNPDEPHPSEPFNPLTDTAPAHGLAYLYNNAQIENAKAGITTAYLNAEGLAEANEGGIVWAESNTVFRNNQVGVRIANPHNALLRISRIQNCRFEITDNYLGGSGQPVGIAAGNGTLHIPIKGNVFVNTQSSVALPQRGTGILNAGTGMRIGEPGAGNRFENLYKGIDYYAGPTLTAAVNIQYNEFIQVHKCLTLNGGIFARVENNLFEVTNFGNAGEAGYGIYTERASGFHISKNVFNCTDAIPALNVAVELRRDIDYAAGTLTDNTFDGAFAVANIFSGKNPHLTIDCNQYHYPINWDWLIYAFNSDDYLADQGECETDHPEFARRNSFKPGATGNQYFNILNATNTNFTYNAQSSQFVPVNNFESPGEVEADECFNNEQPSHCAFDDPCNPDCWRQLLSQTSDPNEQMRLYTALVQERIRLQQTTLAKTDLEEQQRTETDKILAATYTNEADSANAVLKLAAIPLNNTENIEFVNLYLQILQGILPPAGSGKAMSQQETLLRNMAANANNTYSVLAQSLIAAYYAEPFDKKPLAPPKANNSLNAKPASIYLFPNPANTTVQIYMSVPNEDAPAQLYVADMQGRIIVQLPITKPQLTLQTAQYPNGIYTINGLELYILKCLEFGIEQGTKFFVI